MNRTCLSVLVVSGLFAFVSGCTGAPPAEPKATALEDDTARVSYAIGYDVGRDMHGQDLGLVPEAVIRGLRDGLGGAASAVPEDETRRVREAFQAKQRQKRQEAQKAVAARNRAEGAAFLRENGARDGVITTASGLQYEVLAAGDGATPAAGDNVKVHYRGTLIDGTEFDSSYARGQPAVFPVKGVIPGWTEALQLMKEGAKWKLYVPADLAYGDRGAGPKIGPGATLIFEVELLGIH